MVFHQIEARPDYSGVRFPTINVAIALFVADAMTIHRDNHYKRIMAWHDRQFLPRFYSCAMFFAVPVVSTVFVLEGIHDILDLVVDVGITLYRNDSTHIGIGVSPLNSVLMKLRKTGPAEFVLGCHI
jgi:hypothetical protein